MNQGTSESSITVVFVTAKVFVRLHFNCYWLSAFKVYRTVNEGCNLEFMSVAVFFFGKVFQEVHVLAIANFDGAAGFAAKFMKMFIGKISAEFNLMEMVSFVFGVDGFSGNGAESMIVAVIAFSDDSGAAGQLVNMVLVLAGALIIIHMKTPFFF